MTTTVKIDVSGPDDRGICGAHHEAVGIIRSATCELLAGHTGWHRDGGMSWIGPDPAAEDAYEYGHAAGYAAAVANLRDEQRYSAWIDRVVEAEISDPITPYYQTHYAREHVARYLEAVGPSKDQKLTEEDQPDGH